VPVLVINILPDVEFVIAAVDIEAAESIVIPVAADILSEIVTAPVPLITAVPVVAVIDVASSVEPEVADTRVPVKLVTFIKPEALSVAVFEEDVIVPVEVMLPPVVERLTRPVPEFRMLPVRLIVPAPVLSSMISPAPVLVREAEVIPVIASKRTPVTVLTVPVETEPVVDLADSLPLRADEPVIDALPFDVIVAFLAFVMLAIVVVVPLALETVMSPESTF